MRGNRSPYNRPETSFWKTDLTNAETALRQSLVSQIITAKHAAPYMIRNRSGLIVEVTENDILSAGGNPVTQAVKPRCQSFLSDERILVIPLDSTQSSIVNRQFFA